MDFETALNSLLPFIDQTYDDCEAATENIALKLSAAAKIQCSKGCGACCHFPLIPATAGEAFVLIARLLGQGNTFATLSQRFSPYALRYIEKAHSLGYIPFTDEQQKVFFDRKDPCPLYIVADSSDSHHGYCGAFSARPLICGYFNSTQSPKLCAAKKPHESVVEIIEKGEQSVEEIRAHERSIFGRSALGHLPLLLASLCTERGMAEFLKNYPLELEDFDSLADAQSWNDFSLYCNLLDCIGYTVTAKDLRALAQAQEELALRNSLN